MSSGRSCSVARLMRCPAGNPPYSPLHRSQTMSVRGTSTTINYGGLAPFACAA